jgi:poly(ADP-ribose) glycohydrolase
MLFMDALELDMFDRAEVVPDLLPGNVEREIRKSYTAFSSGSSKGEQYTEIFTGLWGCRTFGGDWQIKTIILWCAAAMSGVSLHFVYAADQQDFATNIEAFTRVGLKRGWTVGELLRFLYALEPDSKGGRNAFAHTMSVLSFN